MVLYFSVIGIAMAIILVVNIACQTAAWYYIVIATVWCTALQFAIDISIAGIIKLMPDGWFGVDNPHYLVTDREKRFYGKLKVRYWKDYVWELGGIGGFSKKVLKEPDNPKYIEKFIIECNKGVLTHRLSYPAGFLAMLTLPNICSLTIALPVSVVNLFLNILPTLALRYNTPMLKAVLARMRKKEAREKNTVI